MSAGAFDPYRRAILDELEYHRKAISRLERALEHRAGGNELLGTKAAAYIWGLCENAALRRMRKIGKKGLDGRWYASRSVIESGCIQDQGGR